MRAVRPVCGSCSVCQSELARSRHARHSAHPCRGDRAKGAPGTTYSLLVASHCSMSSVIGARISAGCRQNIDGGSTGRGGEGETRGQGEGETDDSACLPFSLSPCFLVYGKGASASASAIACLAVSCRPASQG